MESMAYFTAGSLDAYEQPDLSVEAAIVKVIITHHNITWLISEVVWCEAPNVSSYYQNINYRKRFNFYQCFRNKFYFFDYLKNSSTRINVINDH